MSSSLSWGRRARRAATRRVRCYLVTPTRTQLTPTTDWDLEIRKRYTSALYVETHELPTATTISHRLLPTCYEFGLPQGHTPDCPDYLNLATEAYIKEALMSLLSKVFSNGPGNTFIRTSSFKKKCAHEERLFDSGTLLKSAARELPIEAETRRARRPMCMEDLQLALQLGDGYLGQSPFVAGTVVNERFLDTVGIDDLYVPRGTESTWLADGLTVSFPDAGGDVAMADGDEAADGWKGAGCADGRALDDALDEVLGLGDL